MIQLLAIRVSSPGTHESHIESVQWYNPANGVISTATVAAMVQFLKDNGYAYICDGDQVTPVRVAIMGTTAYISIQSTPEAKATLQSLPHF